VQNDRYARGWERLREIHHELGERTMESLQDVSPDLARFIIEFPFGDVYTRPGLPLRERQLITLTALATLGNAQPQLKTHIHAALNVGCTREEIVETFLQVAVYAGFPAALNATLLAKEVFAVRDATL
jgi:4-carboxymuconolactone decarboxylase